MNFKIPFSGRAHLYTQEELNLIKEVSQKCSTSNAGEVFKGI